MFQFECIHCAETIETASVSELQDQGRAHLNDHHQSDLVDAFQERYGGRECQGGCGNKFPVETQNGAGFECPTCGHNHFPQFAGRYVWWRIEVG
jgi:NADH pyrophosphatase NudC (nudix superfamily)